MAKKKAEDERLKLQALEKQRIAQEAADKAEAIKALAEQAATAKQTIEKSIFEVAEQVMEQTGADEETAVMIAENMVAEVFD